MRFWAGKHETSSQTYHPNPASDLLPDRVDYLGTRLSDVTNEATNRHAQPRSSAHQCRRPERAYAFSCSRTCSNDCVTDAGTESPADGCPLKLTRTRRGAQPQRIGEVYGIPTHIAKEVETPSQPDGIRLREPARRRVDVAVPAVEHAAGIDLSGDQATVPAWGSAHRRIPILTERAEPRARKVYPTLVRADELRRPKASPAVAWATG